jgi:virulence-associated protein VapD
MALSKIDAANFLTGTIPSTNVANASLSSVTALPAGVGGKVLQVSQNIHTFSFNTSSSTYVDTGMTTTVMTPASTSSKFLITFNVVLHANNAAYSNVTANFAIYKSVGGGAYSSIETEMNRFRFENTGGSYDGTQMINLLHSPSTTSTVQFKLYMRSLSGVPYLNPNGSDDMTSTLMEIA